MITKNEQSVNTENAVECEFGNAIRELGNSSILKKSTIRKKKGGSVFDIFQSLLLQPVSFPEFQKTGHCIFKKYLLPVPERIQI